MSNVESQGSIYVGKLNLMKVAILQAEKNNVNTRNLTNTEMVELIKKTIISFADKSF